jgi:hypothetical protein
MSDGPAEAPLPACPTARQLVGRGQGPAFAPTFAPAPETFRPPAGVTAFMSDNSALQVAAPAHDEIDHLDPRQFIVIKNARVHNLKNLSVLADCPRRM